MTKKWMRLFTDHTLVEGVVVLLAKQDVVPHSCILDPRLLWHVGNRAVDHNGPFLLLHLSQDGVDERRLA